MTWLERLEDYITDLLTTLQRIALACERQADALELLAERETTLEP